MIAMKKTNHSARGEAVGEVVVAVGLSSWPARQITEQARRFQCTATLANQRGEVADTRNLFDLLCLGAGAGESVTLRCVGVDARVAYDAIAEILAGRQP
jgi:phosphotransferase system HPr (HPr) family protein